MTTVERTLGVVSLTTLLVSSHYGLGFLLGTAEQTVTGGASGSLYGVAVGLGMIGLALLAQFYWQQVEPLWTLLGDRFGWPLKVGSGLMSWISLIGIEAVQIIAVAAILSIVGYPPVPTMIAVTVGFCALSLLPVERASWVVRGLLLVNILVLAAALWRLDHGMAYSTAVFTFVPSLEQVPPTASVGVLLSTVLLVLVDMKCQQFVVRSHVAKIAAWSCLLAGLILIALAFLPSALVLAAQTAGVLPESITGKTVIPFILGWFGGGMGKPWGILAIASLTLPALGLGSNILRIQTKALLDLAGLEQTAYRRVGFTLLNGAFALGIALKGGEIVGLIVCFYAAYLAAVGMPFIAYLLEQNQRISFSAASVQLSLVTGGVAAISTLGISIFYPDALWFDSPELTIMSFSFGVSSFALVSAYTVEKLPMWLKPTPEDMS